MFIAFLLKYLTFIFLNITILKISFILARATSYINFFLIFLNISLSKKSFSIKISSENSELNLVFSRILFIVSILRAVTFEISLIIIFVPNLKFCSYFKDLFSKNEILEQFLFTLI